LKERGNILSQRPEGIGIEAIRLPLRRAEEFSDRRSTQSIEKSENSALLHDER
jgi:hypothetical protein